MSLDAPDLDDRTFQDLVDEAKRRIPLLCPEWTDHNVSDPGVALIELFAWMTELTLFRLNQVPDRLYLKFLDLIGLSPRPPAAARAQLTFWLSKAQAEPVRIPAGTQVGTVRTEQDESVVFATERLSVVVPPVLSACVTYGAEGHRDHTTELTSEARTVACFSRTEPGDAFHLGFRDSLAGNVVRLRLRCPTAGLGVDPTDPPMVWEAWTGGEWAELPVFDDTTHALNQEGDVTVALPEAHPALAVGPRRAHFVRLRLLEPREDQAGFRQSPSVEAASAVSVGCRTWAQHATVVPPETLGISVGTPGQRFRVRHAPVLPRVPGEHVEVRASEGVEDWTEVRSFASSGPSDRHFLWHSTTGEIAFGPAIRDPDGTLRQLGAVPPAGAEIAVTAYRYGGGSRGNVGAGTIVVPKATIPLVARVENLAAAGGGVDAESVDDARARAPMWLRAGDRAVTREDYERLALAASPRVARARCLRPADGGEDGDGVVRVLLIPHVGSSPRTLHFDELAITSELRASVERHLDERRMLTSLFTVDTPRYVGLTVAATLVARPGLPYEIIEERALEALYRYVNPLRGGPDGAGWPFERAVTLGEIFALLAGLPGVVGVEEVQLYSRDLRRGTTAQAQARLVPEPHEMFVSFDHQVRVHG